MVVSAPATAFRFRSLGPSAALLDGAEDRVVFETRKHLLLLFYLARQPGRPVSRDELTDLFWHGDDEKKARHSLSHAISLTNKAMRTEAIVSAKAGRVMLPEGVVSLDLREFERLVAEGQYLQARELWNGRLFEGYWVPRAPKVEEWLNTERSRMDLLFRRVLHQLIEQFRSSGDHDLMRRESELLLALDDLDEQAMLACLEALTLLGDRTLALRRYKEFRERLITELHAEPNARLRAWMNRVSKADIPTRVTPTHQVSEGGILPASRPLYGRDAEFSTVWTFWEEARNGRGSFVIVEGPAGIGKSALAAKIANQVHVAGGAVCFVKCYRTDKAVPFAPITALIRQLSRLPGFVATSANWLSELARLYPELKQLFQTIHEPMAIDDSARLRICDATIESAKAVADEQPLLILVDDVLNADEASLALVHYLGRQVSHLSIMLLCTARTSYEDIYADEERTFLETSRSARLASFILLPVLSNSEIAKIAANTLAQQRLQYSEASLEGIARIAAGNPLAAIEAAMMSSHQSKTASSEPLDSNTESHFDNSSLKRLQSLSSEANLVAAALAVSGRPLSEYELLSITALKPAELSSGTIELERAHFVRRAGGSVGLSHERYAAGIEARIHSRTRQQLHAALAKHLKRTGGKNPACTYELAIHLRGASKIKDARRNALSAVDFAASVGSIRGKADALELAIGLTDSPREEEIVELARSYLSLNDLDALRTLLAKFTNLTLDRRFFETAIKLQSGDVPLTAIRDELISITFGSERYQTEAEALLLLLRVADKTFSYELVKKCARELRRYHPKAFGCFATAYLYAKYYRADKTLNAIEHALRVAQAERNWPIEQLCRDGLGIALKQVGRYKDSIRQFEYGLGLARKTMNPHAEIACLHNRAVTEMCLGEYEQMRSSHSEAAAIMIGPTEVAFSKYRTYNEALAYLFENRLDDAEKMFRVGYETTSQTFPLMAAQCAAGLALVAQRRGDLDGILLAAAEIRKHQPASDRMTLAWIDTAALAYADTVSARSENKHEPLERLQRHTRGLLRRDISFWLAESYEVIKLREMLSGKRDTTTRLELRRVAERFGALGVCTMAMEH